VSLARSSRTACAAKLFNHHGVVGRSAGERILVGVACHLMCLPGVPGGAAGSMLWSIIFFFFFSDLEPNTPERPEQCRGQPTWGGAFRGFPEGRDLHVVPRGQRRKPADSVPPRTSGEALPPSPVNPVHGYGGVGSSKHRSGGWGRISSGPSF
jgi:hypothetical protein